MRLSLNVIAAMAVLAAGAVGCSAASSPSTVGDSPHVSPSPSAAAASPAVKPGDWAAATSAAEGGGMRALIAAAKKEGTLNVIALPPTWANYATIVKTFSTRYGITVHSIAPGARSAQEIAQITRDKGSARAADVLDIEMSDAVMHRRLFAPYRVTTWAAIPAAQKAADGSWVQDYGGFMSIGYNAARFGKLTSIRQLLGPRFARSVALDGNPVQASA